MLSTLFSNDVRQTLDQFRRSVDQMFDNFYGQSVPAGSTAGAERNWMFTPVVESGWNDEFLNLRAILPKVMEKDVHVTVQNNQLIIEGERKAPEGFDKSSFTQLAYGKFYTALTLPGGLDVEHVDTEVVSAWGQAPKLLTSPVEKAIRAARIKPECAGKKVWVVFRYELHGEPTHELKVTSRTDGPNIMWIESQPAETAQVSSNVTPKH